MSDNKYVQLDQSVDAGDDDETDHLVTGVLSGPAAGGPGINYDISRVKVGKPCKSSRICGEGKKCYKREGNPPKFTEITEIIRNQKGELVSSGEEGNCVNLSQAYGDIDFGNTLQMGGLVAARDPETIQGCLSAPGRVGKITRIYKPSRRESEIGSGELIYDVTCLNKSVYVANRQHRGYWWNEIRAATQEEIRSLETETGEFDLQVGDYVVAKPGTTHGCLGSEGRVGKIHRVFGASWRDRTEWTGELYYKVRCLNMCFMRNREDSYWCNHIQRATDEEVDTATQSKGCLFGGGSIKIHKKKKQKKKTKRKRKKTKRRKRTVKKSKRRNR